jgi:FkbM family methyltransferase
MRRVVDVGAHIGVFASLVREVYPDVEVACVEVDPANVALLRRNAPFATLFAAACTYEAGDLQLFSTVHPLGRTTGGGFVAPRGSTSCLEWENAEEYAPRPEDVAKITLEEIAHALNWDAIDLLKLDCEGKGGEGGEWSSLGKTTMLARIGVIVGEYHGERRQRDEVGAVKLERLLARRFEGWDCWNSGEEIGLFRLVNPAAAHCC